jgi:hypothetical protein
LLNKPTDTTLTAFFDLNRDINNNSRHLLYQDIPGSFTFKKVYERLPGATRASSRWKWVRRQGYGRSPLQLPPVGRIYHVAPSSGELYYLRLLLNHVPGPTSFEDLLRVPTLPVPCTTYQQACRERGLLADDEEVHEALEEAALFSMPGQIRDLFAYFLASGICQDPLDTWTRYSLFISAPFHSTSILPSDTLLSLGSRTT